VGEDLQLTIIRQALFENPGVAVLDHADQSGNDFIVLFV
jgi:hypothetical protein